MFGIGSVTASICKSILFDQRNIRPVSHYQEDMQVCLSKPAVLGRKGVASTVQLPISSSENEALLQSASEMRKIVGESERSK